MTVEEVCRGFGVHAESALMRTMRDKRLLSDNQAVACLGRSVHVGVARCIVAELRERGVLPEHVRYGSAYSGVDTFAVAMEAELGASWEYVFGSKRDKTVRAALLSTWGPKGLTSENCYDAPFPLRHPRTHELHYAAT